MTMSEPTTSGLIWFAARTRPGHEVAAVDGLRQLRFNVYLPSEKRLKRLQGRTRVVARPLIPGLMFVGRGPDAPMIHTAVTVTAVQDLVRRISGEPAEIRREAGRHPVYALQAMEAAGDFDHTPRARSWAKGERVKITAGCFTGLIGEVLAAREGERVYVLLSGLFAGWSGVPVDPKYLVSEPARSAA